MAWFRRRERREQREQAAIVPYAPRHAGWAAPAVPPEPPEPVAVRLGFADGTEIALEHSHPSAVALRTVADVIARDLG